MRCCARTSSSSRWRSKRHLPRSTPPSQNEICDAADRPCLTRAAARLSCPRLTTAPIVTRANRARSRRRATVPPQVLDPTSCVTNRGTRVSRCNTPFLADHSTTCAHIPPPNTWASGVGHPSPGPAARGVPDNGDTSTADTGVFYGRLAGRFPYDLGTDCAVLRMCDLRRSPSTDSNQPKHYPSEWSTNSNSEKSKSKIRVDQKV